MLKTNIPTNAAFTTAELKTQMRVDSSYTTEDSAIDAYGLAAQRYVENRCKISIGNGTYSQQTRDYLIPIQMGDLSAILLVEVADKAGVWTSITTYRLDIAQSVPYVVIDEDVELPYAFRVSYQSSADDATTRMAKECVLLLASHWYNMRESVISGTIVTPIPHGLDMLCDSITLARV